MTNKRTVLSLILKAVVVLSCISGVLISFFATEDEFMRGEAVFMFFTIQSNILIALICLLGGIFMLLKRKVNNYWYIIKFVGTVSITLTGFVFCFVLAPTLADRAWNIQNVLTHVVIALFAIADLFVAGTGARIEKRHVLFVTIPPLLYAIYAGIGYIRGWNFALGHNYPYFFLNWGSPVGALGFSNKLPYMGCVWWILLILAILMGVGFLYRYILGVMIRRKKK